MWRAARLEADFYEEVEAEPRAIVQATVVVVLSSLAAALGTWLDVQGGVTADVRLVVALDLIEPWVVWIGGSFFAYTIGATLFRGPETETDFREVLRTVGFSFTPGLLHVFAFVPPPMLGYGIVFVAELWMLAAGVVAIRQALDFTTVRAIATFGTARLMLLLVLRGLGN